MSWKACPLSMENCLSEWRVDSPNCLSPAMWMSLPTKPSVDFVAFRKLKEQEGPDLQVHGSAQFLQTLLENGLIAATLKWAGDLKTGSFQGRSNSIWITKYSKSMSILGVLPSRH